MIKRIRFELTISTIEDELRSATNRIDRKTNERAYQMLQTH